MSTYYVDWENKRVFNTDGDSDWIEFWDVVIEQFEYEHSFDELMRNYLAEEYNIDYESFIEIVPYSANQWLEDIENSNQWYEYRDNCIDDYVAEHYSQYMFPDGEQVFINFDQQIIGVWEEVYDAFMFDYMQEYTLEDYNDEFVDGTEQEYMEYVGDIVSAYIWDHTKRI